MMRILPVKRLVVSLLLLSDICLFGYAGAADNCGKIDGSDATLAEMVGECRANGTVDGSSKTSLDPLGIVQLNTGSDDYTIDRAKQKIFELTRKLVVLAGLLAVGGLVYAGILLTTAYGEDAKQKKGKEAIKWSLLGFAFSIVAQQLINAVINLVYTISGSG